MKIMINCIVLLSSLQYAYADMTLVFNDAVNKNLVTFNIKNQLVKMTQSGQDRINIFDANAQEFVTVEQKSGQKAVFNKEILANRVSQLTQRRITRLAKVEQDLAKRLKTMSLKEQEVGEEMVNLLKYPETYGEHTQLKVKKTQKFKEIHDIRCQIYQLFRTSKRIKEVCMASAEAFNVNAEDYQTLRAFYAFNYSMQTRLLLAMGRTRFNLIDYDTQNVAGIVIETIDYDKAKVVQHLTLASTSSHTLESALFNLPASRSEAFRIPLRRPE